MLAVVTIPAILLFAVSKRPRGVFVEFRKVPWRHLRTSAACQVGLFEIFPYCRSEVLAPADIATLGAICGLASFDRKEVKSKLLEHPDFTEVTICSC